MSEAAGRTPDTDPLTLSVDVDCSVEHAFRVWTTRIGSWWPRDHTVSGRADAEVVLERRLGGRIFERTPDGREHDWGRITAWEPPTRLAYRWHLKRPAQEATDVDIRFVPHGERATRIEILHSGWDPGGDPWRARNQLGWQALLAHLLPALTAGSEDSADG